MITVTVVAPERTDLTLQAQIRAGAGSVWQEMIVGEDNLSAYFGPLPDGDCEVRARWNGALNAERFW